MLPLAPDGEPVRMPLVPISCVDEVSIPIVPIFVVPVLSRENEATMLTVPCAAVEQVDAVERGRAGDAASGWLCRAVMSLWIWAALVPGVCAVTRSCFILFMMVSVLVRAAVATPTVEEPRFRASVTEESALVSDFMVVEIDQ